MKKSHDDGTMHVTFLMYDPFYHTCWGRLEITPVIDYECYIFKSDNLTDFTFEIQSGVLQKAILQHRIQLDHSEGWKLFMPPEAFIKKHDNFMKNLTDDLMVAKLAGTITGKPHTIRFL